MRFLGVGHVTWDRIQGEDVVGGTVAYAALAAGRLGWEPAVLSSAGADFDAARDLPGVATFVAPSPSTTRFKNLYDALGRRELVLVSRAADIALTALPDAWRAPDVLLLGPVAGEVPGALARALEAQVVGATAQGWLRRFDDDGSVSPRHWADARIDLEGVHVLFLSEHDLPNADGWARARLSEVPLVVVTRGWRGVTLFTRQGANDIPGLPRSEVDPTGAGDVFAAAFLLRYHETSDFTEAAEFANCAASCAVEALGTRGLGSRPEVLARMERRKRLIEEGDWDE
jgi:sugar/nucleoside kinase (ribokinase family)